MIKERKKIVGDTIEIKISTYIKIREEFVYNWILRTDKKHLKVDSNVGLQNSGGSGEELGAVL